MFQNYAKQFLDYHSFDFPFMVIKKLHYHYQNLQGNICNLVLIIHLSHVI